MTAAAQTEDAAYQTPRDVGSKLRMWFDPRYVCVLTIGKTASSAIIEALVEAKVAAYQAHTLSLAPQEYLFVNGLPARPLQNIAFQIKTWAWLRLTSRASKRFVTTFRDPFARNMSAFFEQSWKLNACVDDMDTDTLIDLYERHGPHEATRTWFADNLEKPFGLRVEDLDLLSQSSQVLTKDRRRFLFMKYEDQSVWEPALSEFCGAPITLQRKNDSTKKSYSDAISRLKKAWRPSKEVVKQTIELGVWNSIYTDAEKERIRERWDISPALAP